jgi:hypothetical protein
MYAKILKGDTPGHPFHGNQWTASETSGTNPDWQARGPALARLKNFDALSLASHHGLENVGSGHFQGDVPLHSVHNYHRDLQKQGWKKVQGSGTGNSFQHKESPGITLATSHSPIKGTSNHSFDVKLLGGYKEPTKKGDTPGHDFHGNQYTNSGGGLSKGDKVKFAHQGSMKTGTVVRVDQGSPESPFAVVDHGAPESAKVPLHALQKVSGGSAPKVSLPRSPKGMPLKGHPYHTKTDAELHYIYRDAGETARLQKGMPSEGKYLDQMNDASTVLYYRSKGGKQVAKSEKPLNQSLGV